MSIFSKRIALRWIISLILFCVGVSVFPHRWCGRHGKLWYDGDARIQSGLSKAVEKFIRKDLSQKEFSTGTDQFDGEWLFGTYFMAGMAYGQTALEHPEWRDHNLELMSLCIDKILTKKVRAFDEKSWQADPLEDLDVDDKDHAAYLGYLNLLMSFERWFNPHSKHASLNDQVTKALTRRLAMNPLKLLETYPSEIYPVDNCAVIASIGLYDRATGSSHQTLIQEWVHLCEAKYRDPKSGLFFQAITPLTGGIGDDPRGSGTSFGLYFLSFMDINLSRKFYEASHRELSGSLLGFGTMREYPRGYNGQGDIDSGPVLLGIGLSPTGFMIGGARIHRDQQSFEALYKTANLFGAPLSRQDEFEFVTGGPLGNAIMFAMLTAQPGGLPLKKTK
jgi:hypothetical protein